jgi:hypothetical protein
MEDPLDEHHGLPQLGGSSFFLVISKGLDETYKCCWNVVLAVRRRDSMHRPSNGQSNSQCCYAADLFTLLSDKGQAGHHLQHTILRIDIRKIGTVEKILPAVVLLRDFLPR